MECQVICKMTGIYYRLAIEKSNFHSHRRSQSKAIPESLEKNCSQQQIKCTATPISVKLICIASDWNDASAPIHQRRIVNCLVVRLSEKNGRLAVVPSVLQSAWRATDLFNRALATTAIKRGFPPLLSRLACIPLVRN